MNFHRIKIEMFCGLRYNNVKHCIIAGGPLFIETAGEFTQIGLVSYGYGCATSVPGVYTRLQTYSDWLRNITGVESYKAGTSFIDVHAGQIVFAVLALCVFR